MPRLGSGPSIGLPHINASPEVGCSKPAMMRSNVDLPQPEAPIRQMNSPLAIARLAPASALIVWSCSWKFLETPLISTICTLASAIVALFHGDWSHSGALGSPYPPRSIDG